MNQIDPPLLRLVDLVVRAGDIVWDIGCNIGLFAVAAAARAGGGGRVVCFEPDPWLLQLLARTAGAQPAASAPIDVVPCAVAADIGFRTFLIATRSRASNALADYGNSQMGGGSPRTVCTFNLDALLDSFPAPAVMKIDVEGAEVEALKNQTRMLNDVRPHIICEVAPAHAAEVTDILRAARYSLFDGDAPGAPAPVETACWNTVAVPQDKTPPWRREETA